MKISLTEAARLAHKSERQILRWLEIGRVVGSKDDIAHKWFIDLDSLQQCCALDPALLQGIAEIHGLSLASLQARIDELEAKVNMLLARQTSYNPLPLPRSTADRSQRVKTQSDSSAGDTLPEGLQSLREICESNDISFSTIKKAMDSGRLKGIHQGNWKKGKAIVRYAVDDEQARQIVAKWGHRDTDE